MNFQHRAPLTAIERERRAAVLAAVNGHSSAPIDIGPDDIETLPRKPTIDEPSDERQYREDGGASFARCKAVRCAGIR